MSVVSQSGDSAIPADHVAFLGSVSAYTASQFAPHAGVSGAAWAAAAPKATRLCAAG
jgi:hypothetical protein